MGIQIKGINISKNNTTPRVTQQRTLEDVSGSLERTSINTAEVNQAIGLDVRGPGSSTNQKTPMGYIYNEMKDAEMYYKDPAPQPQGVPSLFNPYSIYVYPGSDIVNKFYDIKDGDENTAFPKFKAITGYKKDIDGNTLVVKGHRIKIGTGNREITMGSLLNDFDPDLNPTKPYYATDFMYAKYYKKIPLNRLITIRRFPYPTFDNLEFGQNSGFVKPIAQAITFFGDPTGNKLAEITKMNGKIKWEKLKADVHDVQGNEKGWEDSPIQPGNKTGGAIYSAMTGKGDIGGFKAESAEAGKYNTFEYTNKVLGPVNVINETHTRGRGIGAELEYSITFHYKLKSYNNINPRIAMIDLISNLLALSFNNAKFWGGANRYFPKHPQFAFFGDQKAFYEGRYGDYFGSLFSEIGKFGDVLSGILGSLMSGDLSPLTDILKGAGTAVMDMKRAKSRPQVIGFKALLTGLPVGEWHMTVGNPYKPILSVGNLICESFELSLSEELGVDDFPEELMFTIDLKSGRPRDKGDLESMLSMGNGRTYYPPKDFIDITNMSASTTNSPAAANNTQTGTTMNTKIDQGKVSSGKGTPAPPDFLTKLTGTVF